MKRGLAVGVLVVVHFKNREFLKKALLTNVQMPITGEVVKKHFNTFGYCAAFVAIMLSLMPCCCAMSRITSALCGGKNVRSCCRQAKCAKKSGGTSFTCEHKCCCDQSSKVKEKPSTATVDFPVVDHVVVAISTVLASQHSDAISTLIGEHSSAPPGCPIYLFNTNLLI